MIADPPLREFAELTERPDGRIDLARAALVIARWEYPALDVEAYLERLDALARGVDGSRTTTTRATVFSTRSSTVGRASRSR